jgi:Niemann-Pick C1 protein
MVNPDTWQDDLRMCVEQPVACLPPFKQPLKPSLILSAEKDGVEPLESNSMITTWVLKNGVKGSGAWAKGNDFEVALRNLMMQVQSEATERGLRLSFSTERSLEEELNKSTNTDAQIVVISYLVMFLYASLSLGSTFTFSRASLVSSKFTLGLFGILIVLLSVVSSVGIFSAFGVKTTLIIAEVIPFFVLAVGVDNIFLLVHEFQRMNARFIDESIEQRAGRALGRMGPSILLSAVSETVAFSLGAAVGMPAVRNFAIYAAGAVVFDATLQCTMFVAALALDQKRTEANRMDCFPFVKFGGRGLGGFHYESRLSRFVRRWYAPLLIKRTTKGIINILFFGILAAALALLPGIQLGLDQRIAIPNDSYLIQYFNDLDRYFVSGPPVYFVTQNINVTTLAGQQALCGRFSTCNEFSMANILEQERKRSEVSFIAEPAASWIDDFIQWLNPEIEKCCRIRKGTNKLCAPRAPDRMCDICYKDHDPAWDTTLVGSPQGDEFLHYLVLWLSSVPNDDCPLGGAAAYADAIVVNHDQKTIRASHFRTSHTNLNQQQDYIAAYKAARRVAGEIQEKTGGTVFPYSVFYIFFDQYISLVPMTFTLLGSALAAIWVASAILLGSLTTAVLLTGTVAMIVVDVAGVMVLWGVSLNAVSLVNLVICVGIGVEFCAHVAKSFTVPNPAAVSYIQPRMGKTTEREERAMGSLVSVGASVFPPYHLASG